MPTVVAPGGGAFVAGVCCAAAGAGAGRALSADVDRPEVDAAVVGRRVDLHHQRAHVVVGGHGLAEPRDHRVVGLVVLARALVVGDLGLGLTRAPPAWRRSACRWRRPPRASARGRASSRRPPTATAATATSRIEFLRVTGSASGGRGGGGRGLGGAVVGALAGGVGGLRRGGAAGRCRCRRWRSSSASATAAFSKKTTTSKLGGEPLPHGPTAPSPLAAARGDVGRLLGLGEADAGHALHVAQARHQRRDGGLALGAAGELDGGRAGDRAADARARAAEPAPPPTVPLSELR